MTSFLEEHGLDPNKLRGQGYDGAGNMSGKTNGAASIISSDYPLAICIHYASHTQSSRGKIPRSSVCSEYDRSCE